jgi:hypothetical protein
LVLESLASDAKMPHLKPQDSLHGDQLPLGPIQPISPRDDDNFEILKSHGAHSRTKSLDLGPDTKCTRTQRSFPEEKAQRDFPEDLHPLNGQSNRKHIKSKEQSKGRISQAAPSVSDSSEYASENGRSDAYLDDEVCSVQMLFSLQTLD